MAVFNHPLKKTYSGSGFLQKKQTMKNIFFRRRNGREKYVFFGKEAKTMKGNAINHGQCLTDETLTDYLEGVLDPAVKTVSEIHLVSCDDCRVKLAFFMKLMKEEVLPDEAVALSVIQEEWT